MPVYCKRFLEHWKPNLCIWSEQEIWPGMVWHVSEAAIPQVLINARMNEKSYRSRTRFKSLFEKIYGVFPIISAQDDESAQYIRKLGGHSKVDGSLKSIAPPLHYVDAHLLERKTQIGNRPVLCVASCHEADEKIVLSVYKSLPSNVLIVMVPRIIKRSVLIREKIEKMGMSVSMGNQPIHSKIRVHLVDKYGELGLWYRLCSVAFVGGSFDETQGHNPWEAIRLGRLVLHGPNIKNFKNDYRSLNDGGLSYLIKNGGELIQALNLHLNVKPGECENYLSTPYSTALEKLANNIILLIEPKHN